MHRSVKGVPEGSAEQISSGQEWPTQTQAGSEWNRAGVEDGSAEGIP